MGCCLSTMNQQHNVLDANPECVQLEKITKKHLDPRVLHSETHTDESGEALITSIRATDLELGLARIPAGFYIAVTHSGLEWRTEIKAGPANRDIVEWSGPIPMPSDPCANVSLAVRASFEFQPILGNGEQLRVLTVTVKQLLDHNGKDVAFMFPEDEHDRSCSSLLVTVRQRANDSLASGVLAPHCLATDFQGQLEATTDQGQSALWQYRQHGERRDLEHAIERFRRALDICPVNHPCYATAQSNLVMAKLLHCGAYNSDLDIPPSLYRSALVTWSAGHPDRTRTLMPLFAVLSAQLEKRRDELATIDAEAVLHQVVDLCSGEGHEHQTAISPLQLHNRIEAARASDLSSVPQGSTSSLTNVNPWDLMSDFQQFGDLAVLQQAISVLEVFIKPSSPWYIEGVSTLGVALLYRFDHLGELSDLEEAILRHQVSVDLSPDDNPAKPSFLTNLGSAFLSRFERLGELSDLEEAIIRQRGAVDLTRDGHPDKPAFLNNLASSFQARFERLGELSDLEEAVSRQRNAVALTPDGPDKPCQLSNLGVTLRSRFERLGELSDLKEAISRQQDAIHLTPVGHPDRPERLHKLGDSLIMRFKRLGELSDLEEAMSRQQEVVHLIPDGHPDRPDYLNGLAISLKTRFERLGQLSDLEEAISRHRDAVRRTPDGHPDKPIYLHNLADSFRARFDSLGGLNDLEDAILRQRSAVDLTPNGHPEIPNRLNSLGIYLSNRFERLGELSDLEEAISRQEDAVHGEPRSPDFLSNLGSSLRTRFECLGRLEDLDEAISKQRDAIDLTSDDHPARPGRLNSLGVSLITRFKHLEDLSDLEEAISRQRDAAHLTPSGHPRRPGRLSSLGISLNDRFERLGHICDLEEAISIQQDAVHLTPTAHPGKPGYLNNLILSFMTRFEHLGEPSDLEQIVLLSSIAACSPAGSIAIRFRASRQWIYGCRRLGHRSLLHACSTAMLLLPQLAWIGLPLTHRYRELMAVADVVQEAAAAAMDSGRPETAVEWLEQGRSIVWGEMSQLRSSYDELSSAHPEHARRLRELSAALEQASTARETSVFSPQEQSWQSMASFRDVADRHRALALKRDELLQDIRKLPGFERFLLHKEFSQLRAAAHAGPVVMLNAAETRCDALIVLADLDHVIHVPLPKFSLQRSIDFQASLMSFVRHAHIMRDDRDGRPIPQGTSNQWQPILASLWKCVVKPVLDALALITPGDLPRIFWCPTGPFTFLPIHAAGFYDVQHSQPGYKVYDFVVSSYVPSLSVLVPSPQLNPASRDDLRLLTVCQPLTDGQRKLPGAVAELEHIRTVITKPQSAQITLMESSVGTVEEVLALMKEADWVHFACHGIQDAKNPTESGLCLADQRRLKLSDMISFSRPRGGLAFLSACQTAKGDEDLSDEAIHIAAGMLFAGYGGVIGTMWSISDKHAPNVAKDVYEQLFWSGAGPDYREAARALHVAVGRLRDANVPFVDWLPFIHVGL